MSDGAAAAVVMSAEKRANWGSSRWPATWPLRLRAACPKKGLGPVYAVPKALKMAGLTLADIERIELNEAFAAQSLAVIGQSASTPPK